MELKLSKEEFLIKEKELFDYCVQNKIKVSHSKDNKKQYSKRVGSKEYIFSNYQIEDKKKDAIYKTGSILEAQDFFETVDFINNRMDAFLQDYLREISDYEDPKKLFHCVSPAHEDQHPSMSYNPHKNNCHCFACNKTYNLVNLVMEHEHLHYWDAVAFLRNKYDGKELPEEFFNKVSQEELLNNSKEILNNVLSLKDKTQAVNYLSRVRGIRTAHNLVNDVYSSKNRIYFILKDEEGNPVSYQSRNISDEKEQDFRYKKMPGGKAGIFNPLMPKGLKGINPDEKCTIMLFEGEIDALTFLDLYNCSVAVQGMNKNHKVYPIALSSINNIPELLRQLDNSSLSKDTVIGIALDKDKAGEEASKELLEQLKKRNFNNALIETFEVSQDGWSRSDEENIMGGLISSAYIESKDLNEFNLKNREEAFDAVYETATRLSYLDCYCYSEKQTAIKVLKTDLQKYYQMYGIHYLDNEERNKFIVRGTYNNANFNLPDASICFSNSTQEQANCKYPNILKESSLEALKEALTKDYVCAEYKDNYRNNKNFIKSNILPIDIDNDHSDNKEDWITPDDIKFLFKDCSFVIHYSRNNMKEKHNQSARPRFHVLFSIDEERDGKAYGKLKSDLYNIFPYIDKKAVDAGRFFFGTENPQIEIHNGSMKLNKWIDEFNLKIFHKEKEPIKKEEITEEKETKLYKEAQIASKSQEIER